MNEPPAICVLHLRGLRKLQILKKVMDIRLPALYNYVNYLPRYFGN